MTAISQSQAVDDAIRFLIDDDAIADGIVSGPPNGSPLYTDLPGRTTTVTTNPGGVDAVGNVVGPSWEVSFPQSDTSLLGGEPHVFVSLDTAEPNVSARKTANGTPYQTFFVQDAFYTQ